ncbi:MAG: SDR family oxidoreductase [Dehalococcoidia bacterium]|nr:MAG: SDR family oxidoreductase [Dehalococcoidia bacterium]
MSLEGKVAFVSGSSRPHGIGRAIALALARDGADVAVSGFGHFEGAEAVAEEIKKLGRKSIAVKIDVRDAQDVQKGLAKVKEGLGAVSILVNNAAQMGHFVPIYKATIEEFDNEVKICLNSAFYCIKAVWGDMCTNKWGRVVNISSVAGVMGGGGQSSYGASKAGLIALAKTVAIEGARFNITGNAVIVGIAKTDAPLTDEATEMLGKRLLWRRPADPEEIANAVSYLASDEAKYMTGATMNMMGGLDLFVV